MRTKTALWVILALGSFAGVGEDEERPLFQTASFVGVMVLILIFAAWARLVATEHIGDPQRHGYQEDRCVRRPGRRDGHGYRRDLWGHLRIGGCNGKDIDPGYRVSQVQEAGRERRGGSQGSRHRV